MSESQQSDNPTPLHTRRPGQSMTKDERALVQEAFLETFRVEANVTVACDAVGIDRSTVYDWRKRYKNFDALFRDAEEVANDGIDHEIYRRAVLGWEEPLVSAGKHVCNVTKYSDAMLTMLAKSRMKKYREKQQIEMSGPDGGPMQQRIEIYRVRLPDNGRSRETTKDQP